MKNLLNNCVRILFIASMLCFCVEAEAAKIFAHRGGKDNFPENTVYAFEQALNNGADGIEFDVQLTADKVVVLYHPEDLATCTNGRGPVSNITYDELQQLDAAYHFNKQDEKPFSERNKGHKIPTLDAVLKKFANTEIIIDFKSSSVKELVEKVSEVVEQNNAWKRIIFYSTNKEHLEYLATRAPNARMFENRSTTRERLLTLRNQGSCCCNPVSNRYIGFELMRQMTVEETFKLGKDSNKINFILWDQHAVKCAQYPEKIFIFGVNNQHDYDTAKKLAIYAVLSDNPLALDKNAFS